MNIKKEKKLLYMRRYRLTQKTGQFSACNLVVIEYYFVKLLYFAYIRNAVVRDAQEGLY